MSILSSIKNISFRLRHKVSASKKVSRLAVSYLEATHFGILLEIQKAEDAQKITSLVSQLNKDDKHVEVLLLKSAPFEQEIQVSYPFTLISLEQMNWKGEIEMTAINHFTAQAFDYLFCLGDERLILVEYILRSCQAKCRIGTQTGFERENNQKSWLDWMLVDEASNYDITSKSRKLLDSIKTTIAPKETDSSSI